MNHDVPNDNKNNEYGKTKAWIIMGGERKYRKGKQIKWYEKEKQEQRRKSVKEGKILKNN